MLLLKRVRPWVGIAGWLCGVRQGPITSERTVIIPIPSSESFIQYNLRIQVTRRGHSVAKPMTKAAPTSHPIRHISKLALLPLDNQINPATRCILRPTRPSTPNPTTRPPSPVRSIHPSHPSADLCVGLHSRLARYPYLTLALQSLRKRNFLYHVFRILEHILRYHLLYSN